MKIAASNLALPPGDHRRLLPLLAEMGVGGLEIAPAHTWRNMDSAAVEGYRRCVENSGLAVVGLHGLLDGRPDLGLFKDAGTRERTADFLLHLAAVCRDIGGKTLILGNRWRGDGREIDAWVELRGFLDRLLPRIEPLGVKLCLAPLTPDAGDFCATAAQCRMLADSLDEQTALGLHLAGAALAAHGERGHVTFAGVRSRLDHFHIDEPGLAVIGSTGQVDHADLRRHLAAISYTGWVSIVQRPVPAADPLDGLRQAARFVTKCYLPLHTR